MPNLYKICLCLAALASAPSAFAYLDPGTGSMLIQGFIAAIAMASITLKMYWYRIKGFFGSATDAEKEALQSSTDTNNSAN